MRVEPFFDYARRRQQIFLDRRAGKPAPWTDDPVLRDYRFTNIFREDDKVTVWFRENIRDPMKNSPDVLLATVIFRWFNRIETAELLLEDDLFRGWDGVVAGRVLSGRSPVVTGAYIIKTPAGMDKLNGVIWCIDTFIREKRAVGSLEPLRWHAYAQSMLRDKSWTLQEAWNWLRQFPYMGDFMAYEVVTDLRHTKLLRDAPDVNRWANPGPGAARGLCRLLDKPLDHFDRHNKRDREEMIELMQLLLNKACAGHLWPAEWGWWEMREVEHTLCEWDKFERARLGEGRPRQRFTSST